MPCRIFKTSLVQYLGQLANGVRPPAVVAPCTGPQSIAVTSRLKEVELEPYFQVKDADRTGLHVVRCICRWRLSLLMSSASAVAQAVATAVPGGLPGPLAHVEMVQDRKAAVAPIPCPLAPPQLGQVQLFA